MYKANKSIEHPFGKNPMTAAPPDDSALSTLTLRGTRGLLGRPVYRILAASIALGYLFVSMLLGSMLQIFYPPAHISPLFLVISYGQPWWDYPGLLVATPTFVLALPFLPTVIMVLVSIGVGWGMTVAVLLTRDLVRNRRLLAGGGAAPGAITGATAGLTPAMIALVTLGACCSTTAAASAGLGLMAQATGTSVSTLLINNWYLGVFQLAILYVALLAQERLIRVYGPAIGWDRPPGAVFGRLAPSTTPRFAVGAALRIALLAAAVVWALTMLTVWFAVPPQTAPVLAWLGWIFQYQFVAFIAMAAALAPRWMLRLFRASAASPAKLACRIALAVASLALLIGTPNPISTWGIHGLLNEVLGASRTGAMWGIVPIAVGFGPATYVRWAVDYLLLGGFGLALAVSPEFALRPLLWTVRAFPETRIGPPITTTPRALRAESELKGSPATPSVRVEPDGITLPTNASNATR